MRATALFPEPLPARTMHDGGQSCRVDGHIGMCARRGAKEDASDGEGALGTTGTRSSQTMRRSNCEFCECGHHPHTEIPHHPSSCLVLPPTPVGPWFNLNVAWVACQRQTRPTLALQTLAALPSQLPPHLRDDKWRARAEQLRPHWDGVALSPTCPVEVLTALRKPRPPNAKRRDAAALALATQWYIQHATQTIPQCLVVILSVSDRPLGWNDSEEIVGTGCATM